MSEIFTPTPLLAVTFLCLFALLLLIIKAWDFSFLFSLFFQNEKRLQLASHRNVDMMSVIIDPGAAKSNDD